MKIYTVNSELNRQGYYLRLCALLFSRFYIDRGFLICPKPHLKNSSEVVIPFPKSLSKLMEVMQLTKNLNVTKFDDFAMLTKLKKYDLSKVLPILEAEDTSKVERDIKRILKVLKRFFEFLDVERDDFCLKVLPVNFGTVGSYQVIKQKNKVNIYCTYRVDLPSSYFIETLISAICEYKIDGNTVNKSDINQWYLKEYLTDFVMSASYLGKSLEKAYTNTLSGLNMSKQQHKLSELSSTYIEKWGLNSDLVCNLNDNKLQLNNFTIVFTDTEYKLVRYLFENKNTVLSYSTLGNILWGDDPEVFSLEAISKHISNIRTKIKESGFVRNIIFTYRKHGIVLQV